MLIFSEKNKFDCDNVNEIELMKGFSFPEIYINYVKKNGVGRTSEESNSIYGEGGDGICIDWFWGSSDILEYTKCFNGRMLFL